MISIITGVTGQDGSYMSEYLIEKGHTVVGVVRRLSVENHDNITHLKGNPNFKLEYADVTDQHSIKELVRKYQPSFFFNFAANSFVGTSWVMPYSHLETNTLAVIHQLEAIREYCPSCRYYNAGSSEEFGDVLYSPQDEMHPSRPRSPYGASKVAARNIIKVYRESYNIYAVQGYLFNHESPRRGVEFITRKTAQAVARIKNAIDLNQSFEPLIVGNLDAKRDWSHAKDFMEGVYKMVLQDVYRQDKSAICNSDLNEYVLSSGVTKSVRWFIHKAFEVVNLTGSWQLYFDGSETYERNGVVLVKTDPSFYRPAEVNLLVGDSTKARAELGWQPNISVEELVKEMVLSEINKCKTQKRKG